MAEEFIFSQAGRDKLEQKLKEYETVKRRELIARIAEAREYGDLSENAEYKSAKEEYDLLERAIDEMKYQLENAVIIDSKEGQDGVVNIGNTVTFYDMDMEEEFTYQILGHTEASIEDGIISNESPLAQAILGRKVGEEVDVVIKNGDSYKIRILEIKK